MQEPPDFVGLYRLAPTKNKVLSLLENRFPLQARFFRRSPDERKICALKPWPVYHRLRMSTGPQPRGFFEIVQGYIERAAEITGLPQHVRDILAHPKNLLIVNFPVRMDDGELRVFKGYRIQHNNIMGPYKGGIRYHELISLDELKALATHPPSPWPNT